ncbi:MAG: hypothetical protein JXD23_09730 [Spirochaetales bacterium]|nr:hypothetical protein [Spirochaetales bacterium]
MKANADATARNLTVKGIPTHVILRDEYYSVWAGPYPLKDHTTEKALAAVQAAGYKDAFILSETFYSRDFRDDADNDIAVSRSNIWRKTGATYKPLFERYDGMFFVEYANRKLYFAREDSSAVYDRINGGLAVLDIETSGESYPDIVIKTGSAPRGVNITGQIYARYVAGNNAGLGKEALLQKAEAFYENRRTEDPDTLTITVPNKLGEKLIIRFYRSVSQSVSNDVSFQDRKGKIKLLLKRESGYGS